MITKLLFAGAVAANFNAAATVAPAEIPQKMPSSEAKRFAVAIDSSSLTNTNSSATVLSNTLGTKSGVQPCTLCGDQAFPDNIAAFSGSATTTFNSGRASFNICPTPVIVPPVPQPLTK